MPFSPRPTEITMPSHRATARRPFARITSVLAGCLLLGAFAAASAAPDAVVAAPELNRVRIETTLGSFVIELETVRAPLSSFNFLNYVRRRPVPTACCFIA